MIRAKLRNGWNFESTSIEQADWSGARVGRRAFIGALASVKHAVGRDETRMKLCGINLAMRDGGLRVAATDGHRLAQVRVPATETNPQRPATIPIASAEILAVALSCNDSADVIIVSNGDVVTVTATAFTAHGPSLEEFPSIERAIAACPSAGSATVDRRRLLEMVRAVSGRWAGQRVGARLVFGEGLLSVSPYSYSHDEFENQEDLALSLSMPCEHDGAGRPGINARHLRDALASMPGKSVSLRWAADNFGGFHLNAGDHHRLVMEYRQ